MRNNIIDWLISLLREWKYYGPPKEPTNPILYVYEKGTDTLKETFTSKECDIMNTNPIILGENGEEHKMWC